MIKKNYDEIVHNNLKKIWIDSYQGDNTWKHPSAVGMIATYLDIKEKND